MTNEQVWVLVVDDNEDAGGIVADALEGQYHVFSFTDPQRAALFAAGDYGTAYPHTAEIPRCRAIVVFVDLWMGVGMPTGIDILSALREVDTVPVWAILRSAEVANERELLAIAAAEIWGQGRRNPGIHYLPTDSGRGRWDEVRRMLARVEHSVVPRGSQPEQYLSEVLPWIKPLVLVRENGTRVPLLEWLAEPPWRLPYLRLLSERQDSRTARREANGTKKGHRRNKVPESPADIARHFKGVLAAHGNARWLDHDGELIMNSEGIANDNLSFVTRFAAHERFLFGSATLPEIIERHLERRFD